MHLSFSSLLTLNWNEGQRLCAGNVGGVVRDSHSYYMVITWVWQCKPAYSVDWWLSNSLHSLGPRGTLPFWVLLTQLSAGGQRLCACDVPHVWSGDFKHSLWQWVWHLNVTIWVHSQLQVAAMATSPVYLINRIQLTIIVTEVEIGCRKGQV